MTGRPVFPGDFPDPFVLVADGTYWAYATNIAGVDVQVMSSKDLTRWQHHGTALPALPRWASPGHTWAPSVLARDDTYVLFYTVREPASGCQVISSAVAPGPGGPFTDDSAGPLIFQREMGGSIDPSPFVDADGRAYLLWKADANAIGRRSSIWGQLLADDGRALAGRATTLLSVDRRWEQPLIEAPALVRYDDLLYLFYSAGRWETAGYSVGYALGHDPLGRYRKQTRSGPWFGSDDEVAGPGGQEFFTGLDGLPRMAYHGWQPGVVGYPHGARSLRIASVAFDGAVPGLLW